MPSRDKSKRWALRIPSAALVRVVLALSIAIGGLTIGAITTQPQPASAASARIQNAVNQGVANAAQYGITQYVVVLDRQTGEVLANTPNQDTVVGSESLVKMLIAAYYLRQYNGTLPSGMNGELWDMIVRSNNAPASKYWSNNIVPTMASAYGLTNTYNNPPRPGYWGATHITARDMATFLYRASKDPLVSNWLFGAMSSASVYDPSGFNQAYGFNALSGMNHGSKQGWDCDSYWLGPCMIGSVGFTDDVIGAVLQTAPESQWDYMRNTATGTVQGLVAAAQSEAASLPGRTNPEGDFTVWRGGTNGSTLYLSGHAFDGSDIRTPIQVVYTMDGAIVGSNMANLDSPQLRPYGITYPHGLFAGLPIPSTGAHQVCAIGINIWEGQNAAIKCVNFNVPADALRDNPRGDVVVVSSNQNRVVLAGWAIDPSNLAANVTVMWTLDGKAVQFGYANLPSNYLYAYGVGGQHGAFAAISASPGNHQVCMFAFNIGWGQDQLIACRNATVRA